jgi:hypothetical protein
MLISPFHFSRFSGQINKGILDSFVGEVDDIKLRNIIQLPHLNPLQRRGLKLRSFLRALSLHHR